MTPRTKFRHVKKQTWDSGNPEAVDGYVTWCGGCGQRPWPCDTAIVREELLAELRALADSIAPQGTIFLHSATSSCMRDCHETDRAAVLALLDPEHPERTT